MTLDQIVNFISGKVLQFDGLSLAFCADAVNRRYEMIYDAENWFDTQISTIVPAAAGARVIEIPAALSRVFKIQTVGGKLLDPVTTQFILDSYPELLISPVPGEPRFWEDFTNTLGTPTIQLYPPTADAISIFALGRRTFVPLSGPDHPIIRNIENCLIAFATSDMLERQRQYSKAQAKLQEGAALLEALRKLEQEQSNLQRTSAVLTVAGDSLAEMTDAVCSRVNDYAPRTKIMVRDYLRRNYLELYDSQLWPESILCASVVRDGSEIVLPEYIDRVIGIRSPSGTTEMDVSEQINYFNTNPQIFEQISPPVSYSVLTSVAVAVLPPQNDGLIFVSDDDFDNSPIFIRGETSGVEVSETVQLTGKASIISKYAYDTPITLAKQLTNGKITVTGSGSNAFLVELLPEERERKHVRIWILPVPQDSDGFNCLLLGKRRIKPLMTDEDTPVLRGMGSALINMATADMFEQLGNAASATTWRTKAALSIQTVVDREIKQTSFQPRAVPYAEPSAMDNLFW